jgi:hypothetical protein
MRAILATLAILLLTGPAAAAVDVPRDIVRLGGLDKVTARVSTFDVHVGETVSFGTLDIKADACFEASPTDPPESAAFLQIIDLPPGSDEQQAFAGWMFASSPALSALEHPVFDVWVVDCLAEEEIRTAEQQAQAEDDVERGPPRRRP